MHDLPVRTPPGFEGVGLRWIGTDAGDDHRERCVACTPCGGLAGNATDRAVDRVQVQERQRARRSGRLRDMRIDCLVWQRLDEVALPVPLQPLWEERIEERVHGWKGNRSHPIEDWGRQRLEQR